MAEPQPTREMPTAEDVRKLLHYDPETGVFRWRPRTAAMFKAGRRHSAEHRAENWNAQHAGEIAGATHPSGYQSVRIGSARYYLHRVGWLLVHDTWPDGEIDHVDHDRGNNRIANLRAVDRRGNGTNASRARNNASGTTGVSWKADKCRWRSEIKVRGRKIHLGYFTEFDDAVAARKAAERANGFHPNHGQPP